MSAGFALIIAAACAVVAHAAFALMLVHGGRIAERRDA